MSTLSFLLLVFRFIGGFLLSQRKHFLTMLLIIEVVVIIFIFGLPLVGLIVGLTSNLLIFFLLTVGVCEASVGLSIIVFLVRFHGRDYIKCITLSGV